MIRRLGNPATPALISATRAAAPRIRPLARDLPALDLPPPEELFAPEQLVDLARGESSQRFNVGAMLDQSPEAIVELEIMSSFDDELEPSRRSSGYAQRIEMAIDGALATLDE